VTYQRYRANRTTYTLRLVETIGPPKQDTLDVTGAVQFQYCGSFCVHHCLAMLFTGICITLHAGCMYRLLPTLTSFVEAMTKSFRGLFLTQCTNIKHGERLFVCAADTWNNLRDSLNCV